MDIDLSILNPKARSLIGLDLSATAVKMLELSGHPKDGLMLECYAIEPLPEGVVADGGITRLDEAASAVERCWRRLGTKTRYVAMAMPTAAVITKKIILPAGLREQEMEVLVESEANQYIPFALEEVNLDFQVIGPTSSGEEVEVLLAAARKEGVEDRVACAEAAHLKPVVMDMENLAMLSAFEQMRPQFPDDGPDCLYALVDVGAHAMRVVMLKGEQQIYAREQAFGGNLLTQDMMRAYGLSHEEAERIKRNGPYPDNFENEILAPYLDNLALEVARALQIFFTSTPYGEIHHLVLFGGGAIAPGVAAAVADRTQIDAVLANPFAGMKLSPKVRAKQLLTEAPALMVACGLALRRFDP
ncbi:MAG: pilus assembly protein PilM [Rhodocyclaceae bacterium]|nr:pilus assembly protein PilM [Rhodocyclaceae bacterium]